MSNPYYMQSFPTDFETVLRERLSKPYVQPYLQSIHIDQNAIAAETAAILENNMRRMPVDYQEAYKIITACISANLYNALYQIGRPPQEWTPAVNWHREQIAMLQQGMQQRPPQQSYPQAYPQGNMGMGQPSPIPGQTMQSNGVIMPGQGGAPNAGNTNLQAPNFNIETQPGGNMNRTHHDAPVEPVDQQPSRPYDVSTETPPTQARYNAKTKPDIPDIRIELVFDRRTWDDDGVGALSKFWALSQDIDTDPVLTSCKRSVFVPIYEIKDAFSEMLGDVIGSTDLKTFIERLKKMKKIGVPEKLVAWLDNYVSGIVETHIRVNGNVPKFSLPSIVDNYGQFRQWLAGKGLSEEIDDLVLNLFDRIEGWTETQIKSEDDDITSNVLDLSIVEPLLAIPWLTRYDPNTHSIWTEDVTPDELLDVIGQAFEELEGGFDDNLMMMDPALVKYRIHRLSQNSSTQFLIERI